MTLATTLNDFPDRLSPMVVKELRQGLRTRMFGGVMLVLHALMVIVTLMGGGAQNADGISGLMDGIVTFVLCIILPSPALNALANEIKKNTLETLVLTELSAGRIVFGKWASMAMQSLVVALSLMPYMVARYVFGGLDLFGELGALGLKWLVGAVIAAFMVCVSTQKQQWLRSVVGGLFGMTAASMAIGTILPRLFGSGISVSTFPATAIFMSLGSITGPLVVLAAAAWIIFSLLSIATTRIAPAASNLAFIKRSVHLIVFLTVSAIALISAAPASVAGPMLGVVLGLACIDALTERANEVPSVYAAFYRRGWLGKAAAWFLAPGWDTGIRFTLLLAGIGVIVAWRRGSIDAATSLWLGAAGVWMPAVFVQLTPSRRAPDLLAPWLVYYVICVVLTGLVSMTFPFAATMSVTPWLACALPSTVLMGVKMAKGGDGETLRLYGLAAASLWPLLLLIASVFAARRTREARREAMQIAAHTEPG